MRSPRRLAGVVLEFNLHVDDLFLDRDRGIKIHLQLARAFAQPRQLHAELLARQRLEACRVAPEFIVFDRLGMVQPDDERGVDVIQETVEAITDQDRWVPGQFLAFPAIVAGKDQQCSGRRVFAQAK